MTKRSFKKKSVAKEASTSILDNKGVVDNKEVLDNKEILDNEEVLDNKEDVKLVLCTKQRSCCFRGPTNMTIKMFLFLFLSFGGA